MALSQKQKDLLFGTLLGDGYLQTETNGQTWRYRASHKAEHQQYLDHKYHILQPLCGSPPILGRVFDQRTNKTYERWSFNTKTQESLLFYANMFYKYDPIQQKWVKDVPLNVNNVVKNLTPQALAYLHMDDGSLKWLGHSNGMRLCTESFSPDGVKRLQNALKINYNIETTTSTKKLKSGEVGLRVLIGEKDSATYREIIKPYLVECMKYKVSDGNKGHL